MWRTLDLAKLIDHLPLGVAVTRRDGRIEYANPHLKRLLDEAGDALIGRELAQLRVGGTVNAGAGCNGEEWRGESSFRGRAGDTIHVLEEVHSLRNASGALAYFIHLLQDLSAQKHTEQLRALAFYDSLTGLPNRNLFNDRLARAILAAERRSGGFALLYIDLDRFKAVNDSLGHEAGDQLLREAAARMARTLRRSDTLARLAGDEFAAILEGVRGQPDAGATAEKILAACGEGYRLKERLIHVTVSVGIGLYPQDGRDAESLLEHADLAMYQAKAQGRNSYCFVALPYGVMLNDE